LLKNAAASLIGKGTAHSRAARCPKINPALATRNLARFKKEFFSKLKSRDFIFRALTARLEAAPFQSMNEIFR
jgi:hypothetical protein